MDIAKAHVARVLNGRLVLDEPTDLPDGTAVELYDDPYAGLDSTDDRLDDEERVALDASIERGLEQMHGGRGRVADAFLAELRRRG